VNAFKLNPGVAANATGLSETTRSQVLQSSREAKTVATRQPLPKQEEERLFEAGVQWFLAVSRMELFPRALTSTVSCS
jgi:hypothetical protein